MKTATKKYRASIIAAALLIAMPAWGGAPWTIDWWTIDGGGEIFTTGGPWGLSGTVGQWDGTVDAAASGGSWELTGGFWSVSAGDSDHLFKDGFE